MAFIDNKCVRPSKCQFQMQLMGLTVCTLSDSRCIDNVDVDYKSESIKEVSTNDN